MESDELKYWLWWNRVPGIGPARFYKLLEEFGSMKNAWLASWLELKPLLGDKLIQSLQETKENWDPELELKRIYQNGFRIYCFLDQDYPSALKKISNPPPVLYAWGGFKYGDDLALAIVGTRNPTPSGAYNAKELAAGLSRQGLTIVSGMARGIDSESHRGALEAKGRTIAVLGCGLDIPYPPENESLMREIAANGVVISEFPLGTEPFGKNFPARNRIISGLSLGVVVVEAAHDSGSLITAGFALEQGREVFAVPGNIGNESSKGPHKLIRQGAKLVENYQDILEGLAIPHLSVSEIACAQLDNLSEIEQRVIRVMSREPAHIDQILRRTDLASAQLNSTLVQLELKGIVKHFPGQLYLRVK
ncbi:MAG: DNA-processing protein DprA [Firmicutes bacterium]|nr:DNA-processing protein DprA [Bacillota bacterium]